MADWIWTRERDAELKALAGQGQRKAEIASRMGISLADVWKRMRQLGLGAPPALTKEERRAGFFTPDREQQLREMWATKMSLGDMVRTFGGAVTKAYISQRAIRLGLPARAELSEERKARRALQAHCFHTGVGEATDFAGQNPVTFAETPKPRVVAAPDETPCPYIDPARPLDPETGKVTCCGVMVDRRTRRDGTKPGQYCAEHEKRVRSAGGDGTRAGARILPATRAGVMGWF